MNRKKIRKKTWLILGAGFVLGALLAPAAVWLAMSMSITAAPMAVTPAMADAFGSVELAAAVQSLLGGVLGMVAASAAAPFPEDGRTLLRRSLAHFGATAAAFALLLWVCRWLGRADQMLFWLALLALVYALIWLGRWFGWYMEVLQLRSMLGLRSPPSRLNWTATLAYLPFALLVCDLLPLVLRWVDRRFVVDVPLFSGLVLPYLLLPLAGFFSGLALGRRRGLCPLYPPLLFLCYLPMVGLLFNYTALFHCFMAAVPAALGNALGWLRRRGREKDSG